MDQLNKGLIYQILCYCNYFDTLAIDGQKILNFGKLS